MIIYAVLYYRIIRNLYEGLFPSAVSTYLHHMFNRRQFLGHGAAVTSAFAGLSTFAGCARSTVTSDVLIPVDLVPDPDGLLDLPRGFTYRILSSEGDEMDDGLLVPGDHDGMAAFDMPDGLTLVRNHELHPREPERSGFGPNSVRIDRIDASKLYDRAVDSSGLPGGTTTIVLDPETLEIRRQFMSLAGTNNNCAGGPTPWGSWITCEETTETRGGNLERDHGYVFEVPAAARELVEAVPLTAMGRFRHEAIAVDPRTGIVYLTEDERETSLFYRFIPNVPGQLAEGGRLQAMRLIGHDSYDTRNWSARTMPVGEHFAVAWMDVIEPDNPNDDIAVRHIALGATQFTRGEGIWFGDGEMYFTCTDGGPARSGQIFRYIPSPREGHDEANQPGQLELFLESPGDEVMGMCDNITVAPWGDLVVAEDGRGDQYIRGVTQDGRIYNIGRNVFSENDRFSEFCGPCFSPDGSTLFVNVQSRPSRTFAIRGPWQELV